MKSGKTISAVVVVVSIVVSSSSWLAAQDAAAVRTGGKHHHYKLVDMGTFGGPNSWFNSLSLTEVFGFNNVFNNIALISNTQGVFAGFADTSAPDPYPGFCYAPDCFVNHAFQWRNGVKSDLGTLPGGASSAAFWINQRGWITGNSQNGQTDPLIPGLPELRAVLWKNGNIQDLGTLGGSTSFAQAINNRGQITGLSLNGISPDPFSFYYQYLYCLPFQICPPNATQTRAFIWDAENGMQDIGTLGGPDAFPSLINQHGQVAGFSYTNSTPNPTTGFPTLHPFLWEKGKGMEDLGSLGGTNTASVNGLNERGEVVGGSLLPGDVVNHPFLWDGKNLIDLTAPPFDPSQQGEARWINESGDVVGGAGINIPCDGQGTQTHAFLWSKGVITDLGGLPGTPNSEPQFINSATQIVGESFTCEFNAAAPVAFLWENGSMVDLNTLISGGSQFFLYWSTYISDQGEIAAYGALTNGDTHALLLIPCDDSHPNVEGCDYSMVEASTAPAAVNAALAGNVTKPVVPPFGNPMLRRFGGRFGPWNRGMSTESSIVRNTNASPSSTQTEARSEPLRDESKLNPIIPPEFCLPGHCHHGYCEVSEVGNQLELNGICFSSGYPLCSTAKSSQCPRGRKVNGYFDSFCGGLSAVPVSGQYPCSF